MLDRQTTTCKIVPGADKGVKDIPVPSVRHPTKHQTKNHNIFTEDLVQPLWALLSGFSGSCYPGVLHPFGLIYSFFSLSHEISQVPKKEIYNLDSFSVNLCVCLPSAARGSVSNDGRTRHGQCCFYVLFFDQSCLVGSNLGLWVSQSPVPGRPLTIGYSLSLMECASSWIRHYSATPTSFVLSLSEDILQAGQIVGQGF